MPEIALSAPTASGDVEYMPGSGGYAGSDVLTFLPIGRVNSHVCRVYIEWDISGIPDNASITKVLFKYHGQYHGVDCHIHALPNCQPSVESFDQPSRAYVYSEVGNGTLYVASPGFPVEGESHEVDLGSDACVDLYNHLASNWFAIGVQSVDEGDPNGSIIKSEEAADATPSPTLYVEYIVEGTGHIVTFSSVPSGATLFVDGVRRGVI